MSMQPASKQKHKEYVWLTHCDLLLICLSLACSQCTGIQGPHTGKRKEEGQEDGGLIAARDIEINFFNSWIKNVLLFGQK
jgi:hypothetical protein